MSDQPDVLDYYATQGPVTDPGKYADAFDGLPRDIGDLCRVVQGVMLHIFWAERHGVKLSDERQAEVQLRRVEAQLPRLFALDDRPFAEARPYERKLVGNCRDFSVLMAAILRHQGVPARARCGFGTYFLPGHYEDHWVVEVWNADEERWVLVDAQLDELMLDVLKPDFSPLDVPRDRFVVGGQAWQLCRGGQADPDTFGIFGQGGLHFVHGDLIRDFLAFCKVELLPWDHGWGYLGQVEDRDAAMAMMDRIADLTLRGDAVFAEMRTLCDTDPGFRSIVDAVATS